MHEDGTLTTKVYKENRKRFVKLDFDEECVSVTLRPKATFGSEEYHVFAFEVFD